MVTCAQVGIIKPNPCFHGHTSYISPLPKSPTVALSDSNWRDAMYDEYNALIRNSTWILVPKPPNANVVRSMWLFWHKYHADGSLSGYKARLVANGLSQQYVVDCDDTFSPVVKPATIRNVLSLVFSRNWPILQLDVKNAFLNGDFLETVYMYQLRGFVDPRFPHHVCRLQRSLYGLKQAPRAWFQRLRDVHYELGFLRSGVTRMFLSQKKYAKELHDRAHMASCNPIRTLVDTESKLGADGDPVSDPTLYRSLASGLQYLTFTRPDISYVPLDFGLQLYASSTRSLVAYSDADWAGYPATRCSTSGYCVFLGDNLLSWSAKRQHTVSRSSAEAEYRGVANVVAETAWLCNILLELHMPLSSATLVYCDNVSAIYLTVNPVQHHRTKHIEIDIHFVRDMVARGHVRVLHVPSRYQYADIFTKGLPSALFEEFRSSLSVRSSPAPTAGDYNNCTVKFDAFGFSVKDFLTRHILLGCDSSGDLYPVTQPSHIPHALLSVSPSTWHQRLRHPEEEVLRSLVSRQFISCNKEKSPHIFHACQLGKHVRLPFSSLNSVVTRSFEIVHSDIWTSPIVSSGVGIIKPNPCFHGHTSHISPLHKSPAVALSDSNWRDAMYDEYNALIRNSTWILVPKPPNANVVRSMWLFWHKYHADGSLSGYKARLVANGLSQQYGVDCDDTFSPVVKPATIRNVLSLAFSRNWPILQLDVKNAFLNGDFLETDYMYQLRRFVDPRFPHHVCRLQRSLYGLKQAPRAWFQRFTGCALRVGFSSSRCDSLLFIYQHGSEVAYLLIYVDDIVLTASSTDLLQRIISSLHKEFDMTDLGALNYFLGISVTHNSTGMFLSQKKYAKELHDRAHMASCNPIRTLVDTESKLGADGDLVSDPTLYRSLAGGLQYLTFTRPDISYVVQQVCLYIHDPREPYFSALKCILRYVRDWAGCPATRRSTSGYCVFLGDNLLSWSAKRQHTVSRSSVEAEYRGVANVVAETAWLRNILLELHMPLSSATLVYCDNVSAIYLAANPVQHHRTKHIEIDIHFVRDMVARGHVHVLHVPSHYQYADIFTKGLSSALFEEFRSSLSVRSSPAPTAGEYNNCTVKFDAFGFSVKDFLTRHILLGCDSSGDLYPVTQPSHIPHALLSVSPSTWHQRLRHPEEEVLRSLVSRQFISCNKEKSPHIFHACQLGKHVRLPFSSLNSVVTRSFEIVHSDIWTSPIVSSG
ncbi:ribonuclease H-like domain-containing protein, partial [Tanacetum coccineum]